MSPKFKRARKRKKRASLDHFTVGPVTMKRVGKRISVRNRATSEQFVAMRQALAQWKLGAPVEMRTEAEAMVALVADVHPLITLGFIFFVNHLSPLLRGKEMAESYALVEHLALMLAKEPRTGTTMVMDQTTGQGLIESLASQLRNAIQYGLPDLPADGSLPPDDYRDALATILMWELAVRVPRYDHQEKTLLRSLFTTFAAELQAALGFTCDDAMVLEECMTQRIQTMALQGQDIALHVMDDVNRVLRGQPASSPENEAFIAQVRQANPGQNIKHQMSAMLGAWMAFRTAFSFAATLDELVADSGLERAVVERILAALLVPPADLVDYWYMVPSNPLKNKPVLEIDGHYVMPSPGLFLPALQKLFEDTLKPTATWEPYQQHRSRFAEDRAAELFLRAFPGATVYKNLKYKNGTQEGEVDVMVMFDRQLFLIEAKSGAFAEAARRGVISRVEDTLRDLVLKAHEQVQLASAYIASADVTTFKDGATRIEVRKGDYDDVHLVSVTLEQIGHIVNGLGPLLRRENLPKAPWSVSLDDLETITDVLLRPATFLHYIIRRQVLLLQPNIESGDELGFLERYLATSLLEEQSGFYAYDNVMIDPSSKTIDAFEQGKVADPTTEPPNQKVVPEVLMLVDKLAERRRAGWIRASLILLDLPPRLQKALAATMKLVDRGARVPGVVLKGPTDEDVVHLRIDDPKKANTSADGVSLHLDRDWNVNAIVFPEPA